MATISPTSPDSPKIFSWDVHSSSAMAAKAKKIFFGSLYHLSMNAPSLRDRIKSAEFNPGLSLSANFAHLIEGFDPEINLWDVALKLAEGGDFDLVQEMLPKIRLSEENKVLICLLAAKHFTRDEKTTLCDLWNLIASFHTKDPEEIRQFYKLLLKGSISCNWNSFQLFYKHYNETYGSESFFSLKRRVELSTEATKDNHCEIGPMIINPQEVETLSADDRVKLAVYAIQDHSDFSRSLLSEDLVNAFFELFIYLSLKNLNGFWFGIRDQSLCHQQACSIFASFHRWDLINHLYDELESPFSKSDIMNWAQNWLQSPTEKTEEDVQQARSFAARLR